MTTTFTEELVKEFLLSRGGRVKNSELVSKFKNYLNDSARKDENREKFKNFVNTLATIKVDENNEKLIILKKKYLQEFGGGNQDWKSRAQSEPPGGPETDRPDGAMQSRVRSDGMLTASDLRLSVSTLSTNDTTSLGSAVSTSSLRSHDVSDLVKQPAFVRRSLRRSTRKIKSSGGQELDDDQNASVVSVKDRARHLNRIESETELQKTSSSNLAAVRKKDPKKRDPDGDESTSSAGSSGYAPLAPIEKEWLVTCSSSEYHPINEMLSKHPELVKVRDFTSNALHWASKKGRPEVIKMLLSKPGINVNQRTGYTALHLAALHGHAEVIDLLVNVFKADPNMRDYSGKKPKQYLSNSASSRTQQMLVARGSSKEKGDGFMRNSVSRRSNRDNAIKSLIRASTGAVRQTVLRRSWGSSEDVSNDGSNPKSSPYSSPRHSAEPSPNNTRKMYSGRDRDLMPPPSAPSRHKSKRPAHSISKESLISEDRHLSVVRQVPRSESEPNLGDATVPSKQTFI